MTITKPVRMPLQTGATAMKTAVFMIVIFAFSWAVFPLIILLLAVRDARRRRACDIVLDADGYSVDGGPHGGFGEPWAAIEPDTVWVQPTSELFVKSGDNPAQYVYRLIIDERTIAESGDPAEIASLETVRRALQAGAVATAHSRSPAKPPATPTTADVASCPQCGAPLVPGATEEVTCAYCGALAPLPAALRETVRLAREADRAHDHIERSVTRTLRRGGAGTTNWLITGFALSGMLGLVGFVLTNSHGGWPAQLAIFAVPVAFASLAQLLIARRRALRALTLGCAALSSLDPAQAALCRRCRAPLPASDDPLRAIVTCVYCQTKNILGLPLGMAEETAAADAEIESVIEDQRSSTLLCVSVFAASACAVVVGVTMLAIHR